MGQRPHPGALGQHEPRPIEGSTIRLLAHAARASRRGGSLRPETTRSAPASRRRAVQPSAAQAEPPLRIAHETPRSSKLAPSVVGPCRASAAGPIALLCQPGSCRRDERVTRASPARAARHPKRTRSAWTTLTRPLVKLTRPLVKLTRPLVKTDQPKARPLVKLTKRPWSRTRPGSLGADAVSPDDLA